MKTKEYLIRYALTEKGIVINKNGFVADLAIEFLSYVETANGLVSIKSWDNKINMIRQKYDAIKNASKGFDEKIWTILYTEIINRCSKILFDKTINCEANIALYKKSIKIHNPKITEDEIEYIFSEGFVKKFFLLNKILLPYTVHMPQPPRKYFYLKDTNINDVPEIIRVYNKTCFDSEGVKRIISMPEFNSITENKNQTIAWILSKK